ncbi:A/G-specific DNA glycosylase [Sphaerochaeta pleomorpha str. Grapes]|uniref:A/G-specific DNA glycosylase n=1 Tax=Sphaerochaeta pleomorpha (strain ATCC BAA-1885 / DSM 22778 / Grapes) TaxID=158190 RepID=G8QSK1_SPHPG|nr:DNA repair protein [Sphaerochaeta pleomorpha]AEV28962.1 A/G-specific DNA glycosylase [Sphaerochaeta pleomorpha str. Grapes]
MNGFPHLDEVSAQQYLGHTFGEDATSMQLFRDFILDFYQKEGRAFAWRDTSDPYRILLSEVMLQQTQTSRVEPKYQTFLELWPTFEALAASSLESLLAQWKGLGYNRRALNLRKSAQMTEQWGWTIPNDIQQILSLPGVGKSTSAAILCFCYNEKAVYLETNVRRVLLTCFFPEETEVPDKKLETLLVKLSYLNDDMKTWYYALMDYGVLLKNLLPNANTRSAHYTKQSKFENSNRQIRGLLIHILSDTGPKSLHRLYSLLPSFEEERILSCLSQLEKEGFVQENEAEYRIKRE